MELTLSEKIQLLRKRMGLNQGQFGAEAFNTSVDAGRTKIKNIELGKQRPTADDLTQIARVLKVPETVLNQQSDGSQRDDTGAADTRQGVRVDQRVLERFDQLGPYLDMLNRAVSIQDDELIAHIAEKLSAVFAMSVDLRAVNN